MHHIGDPATDWLVGAVLNIMQDRGMGPKPQPYSNKFDRKVSAKKNKAKTAKRRQAATKREIQERKSRNA